MAARTTVSSYAFNPTAGTITLSSLDTVDLTQVVSIYDTTLKSLGSVSVFEKRDATGILADVVYYPYPKGYPIYVASDQAVASVNGKVLTIPKANIPPQAKSSDTLVITYGFPVTPQVVHVQ